MKIYQTFGFRKKKLKFFIFFAITLCCENNIHAKGNNIFFQSEMMHLNADLFNQNIAEVKIYPKNLLEIGSDFRHKTEYTQKAYKTKEASSTNQDMKLLLKPYLSSNFILNGSQQFCGRNFDFLLNCSRQENFKMNNFELATSILKMELDKK